MAADRHRDLVLTLLDSTREHFKLAKLDDSEE